MALLWEQNRNHCAALHDRKRRVNGLDLMESSDSRFQQVDGFGPFFVTHEINRNRHPYCPDMTEILLKVAQIHGLWMGRG